MPRLLPLGLSGLAALLCACGGGGSAYVPTTPHGCEMPLKYANGSTSGIALSAQSPQAASPETTINACNLARLQSATVTVCVNHPDPAELALELRLGGNVMARVDLTQAQELGHSCMAYSNLPTVSLRQFTASSVDWQNLPTPAGPWSVTITDKVRNNLNGDFIAWGLVIEGLR